LTAASIRNSQIFPLQFVEILLVTPAKAGVQEMRIKRISIVLDAGFRRHDET